MKLKTLKRLIAVFLVNKIFASTSAFRTKRSLLRFAGYKIGKGTKIVGPIYCSAKLKIGNDCWIGKNFTCNGNGTVEIGDNCDIGPEVTFQTGGHTIGTPERRAGDGIKYTQIVGSGTWIGGRTTILNNVNIGKSCVVAGCACVVKDVGDNILVGGVPARRIKVLENN